MRMTSSAATSVAAAAAASTSASTTASSNNSNNSSSSSRSIVSLVRLVLLDVPLWLVFLALVATHLAQQLYLGPVSSLLTSLALEGSTDAFGFYPELDSDVTYYNRQCTADDISTTNSNDLIVSKAATSQDAADIMMTHGAVVLQGLLSNKTATDLRAYLESRNTIQHELSWHEKFWAETGRLALGLGVADHPIIGQALQEVSNHPVLQTTVEGILGKDPAIVEISTLSAMHGCEAQGIHTDSDYFGSSLLYSRTYLHSYTLFMALQDTTSQMGATTVCPGTHMCANEDLTDICLDTNNGNGAAAAAAFEVSSNGKTGKHVGLLYKGDGMMFNQNIWHRGPRNYDTQFPINRVMFIVTFVSRRDIQKGDVRIQGMGTYYYQRWNMWGHTLHDLQSAATTMLQPYAALKALGLYKPPKTFWGVSWMEHFARQLANHMDFYADYELPEFKQVMTKAGIPAQWQGTSEEWDPYFRESLERVNQYFDRMHWIGLGVYAVLHLVFVLIGGWRMRRRRRTSTQPNDTNTNTNNSKLLSAWSYRYDGVLRVVMGHLVIGLLGLGVWHAILQSQFCQCRIATPFPNNLEESSSVSSLLVGTTVPERMDALVGSRFDTPFLGIYNKMLDYHPGNQRLQSLVQEYSNFGGSGAPLFWEVATAQVVRAFRTPLQGVESRLLQQDPASGYWTVIQDDAKVHETVRRELLMEQSPLVRGLATHVKTVVADGRFGTRRDTSMAKRFTPLFATHWETVLFGTTTTTQKGNAATTSSSVARLGVRRRLAERPSTHGRRSTSGLRLRKHSILGDSAAAIAITAAMVANTKNKDDTVEDHGHVLQVGDRVYADYERSGTFLEATIQMIYDSKWCLVEYTSGGSARVFVRGLQPYRPVVQGDTVEVDIGDEWYRATVTKVHPLGTYDLSFDDGDDDEDVSRDGFQLVAGEDAVLVSLSTTITTKEPEPLFHVGQRVKANFYGHGQWFDGRIVRVNTGGRTYAIDYVDGDKESVVPQQLIVALP